MFIYSLDILKKKISERYSLISKKWSQIAPLPISSITLGSSLFNNLCFIFYDQCPAYSYDPETNQHSIIIQSLPTGNKSVGHRFILTPNNVLKVNGNNINSWSTYNYKSKNCDCCYCMMNSYVFKRHKYLYLMKCGKNLLRFNTENLVYEKIDYS